MAMTLAEPDLASRNYWSHNDQAPECVGETVKNVIFAGNAATASILGSYMETDPRYKVVGAVVDDAYMPQAPSDGGPCVALSQVTHHFPPESVSVIMAISHSNLNRSRQAMFDRLKELGYQIETYVHPQAMVHTRHPLGEGSLVLPGAVIEPYVQVGVNTVIWSNSILAHHSQVGDHCWIASGAVISGNARIERHCFIGINATIVNEIVIGELNFIGSAALITKATKPNKVYLARSAEEWRYSAEDYIKFFGA